MVQSSFGAERHSAESTVLVVVKAILFLACIQTLQWALYGPVKNRFEPSIKEALKPLLAEYMGYVTVAAIVNAAVCLLLTVFVMKVIEGKKFSDIGLHWTAPGREHFWEGMRVGFLPGMVLALPLILLGLAEASASTSSWLSVPLAVVGAFTGVLITSGYAFQILLRRVNPMAAMILVAVLSDLVWRIATLLQHGWHSGMALSWLISIVESALFLYAFWRSGSLWLPFGLACGLHFAPTGYVFMHLNWDSAMGFLSRSSVWSLSFSFGVPYLGILLACGVLLWKMRESREASWAFGSEDITVRSARHRLSKGFFVGSWTVGAGIGLILVVAATIGLLRGKILPEQIRELYSAAALPLLLSSVVFFVLIYKMWAAIQDGQVRTTPGKAVGFLFIPFYGIYWVFQVIAGFPTDYNNYLSRHSIKAPRLRQGLFSAYVILCFTTWIPFLSILTCTATYIVGMVMLAHICDAVNELPGRAAIEEEPAAGFSLHCISGEFANERLVVPADGIIIGRNPVESHLILSSSEVSNVHARVWPDREGLGIWVEDLQSANGTFYQEPLTRQKVWMPVRQRQLLRCGARLRIAHEAEFRVAS